jgi:hypothetical protein
VTAKDGERGVALMTAWCGVIEGQIAAAGLFASKGGVHSMTLPIARELASYGIRVMTHRAGIFWTPLASPRCREAQDSLASRSFSQPLGKPEICAAGQLDRRQFRCSTARRSPRRRIRKGAEMSGHVLRPRRAKLNLGPLSGLLEPSLTLRNFGQPQAATDKFRCLNGSGGSPCVHSGPSLPASSVDLLAGAPLDRRSYAFARTPCGSGGTKLMRAALRSGRRISAMGIEGIQGVGLQDPLSAFRPCTRGGAPRLANANYLAGLAARVLATPSTRKIPRVAVQANKELIAAHREPRPRLAKGATVAKAEAEHDH